jgi:hypothetical protein
MRFKKTYFITKHNKKISNMIDTIINKIRSLENTTLIIGGIGILLLVILLAYITKRSKKQPSVVEGELQEQDCFGGVCQVPSHIKETLTQEEQIPIPVKPVVATSQIQQPEQQNTEEVQQHTEEVQQHQEQISEEQPQLVEEHSKVELEIQPEVQLDTQPSINTEVLEEPMN